MQCLNGQILFKMIIKLSTSQVLVLYFLSELTHQFFQVSYFYVQFSSPTKTLKYNKSAITAICWKIFINCKENFYASQYFLCTCTVVQTFTIIEQSNPYQYYLISSPYLIL